MKKKGTEIPLRKKKKLRMMIQPNSAVSFEIKLAVIFRLPHSFESDFATLTEMLPYGVPFDLSFFFISSPNSFF